MGTCSLNDIRVWNTKTRQELLRIEVPGLECHRIFFSSDGKSILSGWNDGKIRSFLPQSGKLLFAVNDAHNHGVTSRNTEEEFQISRLTLKILKPFLPHTMDHASS